jgi:hypothetical protein
MLRIFGLYVSLGNAFDGECDPGAGRFRLMGRVFPENWSSAGITDGCNAGYSCSTKSVVESQGASDSVAVC